MSIFLPGQQFDPQIKRSFSLPEFMVINWTNNGLTRVKFFFAIENSSIELLISEDSGKLPAYT